MSTKTELQHFVAKHFVAERVVVTIILINTVAIFLRAFPGWSDPARQTLLVIDYICTVYFVSEVVVKVSSSGWTTYWSSNWNRFDLIIVVLSSPLLLTPFVDLADFGVVLVLRLGRLGRFFRLLRFVPDADRIWVGVRRGLRASIGVILALALYNFMLGLAACYVLGPLDPVHFGDPIVAVYSMFKVFTLEGWYEIPDQLSAAVSSPFVGWAIRAFFVFAVTTGGILGLSMANAVFVDEMVIDNNRELEIGVANMGQQLEELLKEVRSLRDDNAALSQRLEIADTTPRLKADDDTTSS